MKKYYTGIGSRRGVPDDILQLMTDTAKYLRKQGYDLRSGDAISSDQAFSIGATDSDGICHGDIYVPKLKKDCPHGILLTDLEQFKVIAEQCCDHFNRIKKGYSRDCHLRNIPQCIGADVKNPIKSKFMLCWTPNGEKVGGSATTINCCEFYDIPYFNYGLYDQDMPLLKRKLKQFLEEHV